MILTNIAIIGCGISRFWLMYPGHAGNYLTVSMAQDDWNLKSSYTMLLLQRRVIRHWRIGVFMVIIETSFFTRRITSLMSDDEYRALQQVLIIRPDTGPIIQGTGGLRKVRWRMDGRGKSGGIRIIYYWLTVDEQIYMLHAYAKNEQEDLTQAQKLQLRQIVERWSDE